MITIKDIAKAVGVTPSTVGRALADHPRISSEMKARVRAAAEQLGYVAHSAARIMRGGQSRLLGLIIPDVENDFYATMAKAVAEFCQQEGFQLVLSVTEDDPVAQQEHLRALVGARAAGVIIVPAPSTRRESIALLEHLPVVQLIRTDRSITSDSYVVDDTRGLYDATRHLIDLGHCKIAYIGGAKELSTGSARFQGYQNALRDSGIDDDPALVWRGPPRPSHARDALRSVFEAQRPTAVLTGGTRITLGVIEAIHELGLAIPADLSVVGFGDAPWFKWWGTGGLTTVGLPVREIALAGASSLLRHIRSSGTAETRFTPHRAAFQPSLIIRMSTATPCKGERRSLGAPARAAAASPRLLQE